MHRRCGAGAVFVVVVTSLAGCDAVRPTGAANSVAMCNGCHGNSDNAAPPMSTKGLTATTERAVGAHQAHLRDGALRKAVGCSECHVVPEQDASPGHMDGQVEVFPAAAGQLARASGATPGFNADGTCSGVYCHGATLAAGGTNQRPLWTRVDGSEAACGTCHGLPPPTSQGHPAAAGVTSCASCHPGTVKPDGTIDVSRGLHIDGTVETFGHPAGFADPSSASFHGGDALAFLERASGATDCASCHGPDLNGGIGPSCTGCHRSTASARFPAGVQNWQANCTFCHGQPTEPFSYAGQLALAAPPDDVTGRLTGADTPAIVGAHQVHLNGSALASAFGCATCHAVPANDATSLDHLARGAASVTLSGAGQASLPSNLGTYTASSNSCAAYCHNPPSIFGTATGATPAPTWDGKGYACNSCHGSGPAGMPGTGHHGLHTSLSGVTCSTCHKATVTSVSIGTTPGIASTTYHVNGVADVVFGGTYNGSAVSGTWTRTATNGTCSASCHDSAGARGW